MWRTERAVIKTYSRGDGAGRMRITFYLLYSISTRARVYARGVYVAVRYNCVFVFFKKKQTDSWGDGVIIQTRTARARTSTYTRCRASFCMSIGIPPIRHPEVSLPLRKDTINHAARSRVCSLVHNITICASGNIWCKVETCSVYRKVHSSISLKSTITPVTHSL